MVLNLGQAVEVFARMMEHLALDSAEGGANNCGDVSKAFVTLLDANGIRAELGQLIGIPDFVRPLRDAEYWDEGAKECHIVAKVGDRYLDWTRRQYQPDAQFPYVASREELEAEGWEVTDKDAAPYLMRLEATPQPASPMEGRTR